MITMNELVDLRMQQHIAHEIYRQQIMQRIPGKLLAPFISLIRPVTRAAKLLAIISINGRNFWQTAFVSVTVSAHQSWPRSAGCVRVAVFMASGS